MTLSFVKSAEIKRPKTEGGEEGRRGGGKMERGNGRLKTEGEECTTKEGERQDTRGRGVKEQGYGVGAASMLHRETLSTINNGLV